MKLDDQFDHPDDDGTDLIISPVVDRSDIESSHTVLDANLESDYEYTRKNVRQIIETQINVLGEITRIASMQENPRAYEVVSNLMDQMVKTNESLMALHKTVSTVATPDTTQNNTQNNFFSGSTKDLLDMLHSQEDEDAGS